MLLSEGYTPCSILLVEDNAADVRLFQEVLRQTKGQYTLHVVRDGTEALAFLHKTGPHAQAPSPDLIMLDLHLPKTSGREVLAAIKADPALRCIPVLILSSSRSPQDIHLAYGLHANCYIPKPTDLTTLVEVAEFIDRFWSTVATVPPPTPRWH
jgi:CheY-like chemotaxis protein